MKSSMRSSVTRSLVLALSLALAACSGGEQAQSPEAAAEPAAPQQAAPATPWQGTADIKPAYPDQAAAAEMQLDYDTFQFENQGLSVTPLPPHFAKAVDIELASRAAGYVITSRGPACAYKLDVTIGSAAAVVLDPKQGQSLRIGAAEFAGADKVRVSVALQDGAQNNYSCGVLIEPSV